MDIQDSGAPKKKGFFGRLFDSQRVGKGVSKRASQLDPGLKRFFICYKDNFGKLVSANILLVLGNFPLFFLICNLSGYFKIPYTLPVSDLYQNLFGLFTADGGMTPYKLSLYALEGLPVAALASSTVTYVFYALSALTLFTFGIVNVGVTYVLRNLVSGEPVFLWSDFWYAVRRNYRQAIPFGMLDVIVSGLLIYNVYILTATTAQFWGSMLFWSNIVIGILYFFMRSYIYIQMVTFKLSVFKNLKNSLSFALLGIKRNLLALLGTVLLLLIELMLLFGTGGLLLPLAVAAPLTILFSTFSYMGVYAAYFKIKELMIDPYLAEHPELAKDHSDQPAVMRDDVTERERLAEIKRSHGIED